MTPRGPLAAAAALAAGLALVAGAAAFDRPDAAPQTAGQPDAGGPAADDPQVALAHELAPPRPDRRRADRTAVLPPTHTVAPGDTLGVVGRRYGVLPGSLARANAVDRGGTLRPGQVLVLPHEDAPRPASPEAAVAANLAVEGLLAGTAAEFGLDPALVQAVAWRESRWVQRVVSSRGAIGVMQVRAPTGEAMARDLGRELDLYDVVDNVVAGCAYLAHLLDASAGDVAAALAAYHQGPQAVADRGRIPVTQRYVADVLALRDRFAAARGAP